MPGLRRLRAAPGGMLALALALMLVAGGAAAQSSLGIGSSEAVLSADGGPFADLFAWINTQQRAFYRAMTDALRRMRTEPGAAGLLVVLSFAYGVLHAAGPGHGKAVISSYMVANEVALRRGIALSFASAFLQALVALAVVGLAFGATRALGLSMTRVQHGLEVLSWGLVALFGAWLLARKLPRLLAARPLAAGAHVHARHAGHHGHAGDPGHGDHVHGPDCGCGQAHMPDPARLGDPGDRRAAWSAVAAVGIRPCSGAVIVLTFAILNGMWAAGVLSVLAMAVGTAITVSALASLAVTAKTRALAIYGTRAGAARLTDGIEVAGAAMVFLLGVTLLGAALTA